MYPSIQYTQSSQVCWKQVGQLEDLEFSAQVCMHFNKFSMFSGKKKCIGIFIVILSNWYVLSTTYNPPKDKELVDFVYCWIPIINT